MDTLRSPTLGGTVRPFGPFLAAALLLGCVGTRAAPPATTPTLPGPQRDVGFRCPIPGLDPAVPDATLLSEPTFNGGGVPTWRGNALHCTRG